MRLVRAGRVCGWHQATEDASVETGVRLTLWAAFACRFHSGSAGPVQTETVRTELSYLAGRVGGEGRRKVGGLDLIFKCRT